MNRILLIGLDGFRPEMMSQELTPNLQALADAGVHFTNHRCVFPSETYVNTVSILTGQPPGRHGIIANSFFDPAVSQSEPWIGNRAEMIEAGMTAYGGRLIDAPTLGDRLAAAGKRLWLLSGGSPGSARLKHPRVSDCAGHLLVVGQDINASRPSDQMAKLIDQMGRPPKMVSKDDTISIQRYLTDAFFLLAKTERQAEVTVIWYGEPDHSFHTFGLDAAPTRTTLRAMDAELGRLFDWWQSHPERERIQLIVTSDHGHITQSKRVDTRAIFTDAGLRIGERLDDDADLNLVPGYVGNVRLRDSDHGLLTAAAQALMAHPDAGLIFTADSNGVEGLVSGTFSTRLIGIDHQRCPDIVFTLRADDAHDQYGFTGTCCFDNDLPPGVGYHGGLHPAEMSPLLVMAGNAFETQQEITEPTSVRDLLPTMLHLLALNALDLPGRVLEEAFSGTKKSYDARTDFFDAGADSYTQRLKMTFYGNQQRLDCGSRL